MRSVRELFFVAVVATALPVLLHAQVAPAGPGKPARSTPAGAARTATCQVEGVWELVSITRRDVEQRLKGYRQQKMVARGHFMWLGADSLRDTISLRGPADSLRAFRVSGGAGTYTVKGNSYTEQLDIFVDPKMQGQPFAATCRMLGDLWYHSYPPDSARKTVEVWRRIR
jgi:hypothetical protein